MRDILHRHLDMYLEGQITLAEFLSSLIQDYGDRQHEAPDSCLTCGSTFTTTPPDSTKTVEV